MQSNAMMHQGDIVYRVEQLERALYARTSGRSLDGSSIGPGNLTMIEEGSIIIDGGELKLVSPTGVEVARWGEVTIGSGTSRGWIMRFPDGSTAFSMGGSPENPVWLLWDQEGNYLISNDAVSGVGLARPFLNYHIVPSLDGRMATGVADGPFWPFTNSTTFKEIWHGFNTIHHPKISFSMGVAANGGSTEWQLLIDDTLIASGTGNAVGTYSIPGWGTTISAVSQHNIKVMIRNTTGAISWSQIDRCYGRES